MIGGGSSINAQLHTCGNARDYDAWASEAGATGWSYREVLPYFKRSEDNQKLHNAYHSYGGLRMARDILRQPALKPFVMAERMPGDDVRTDEQLAEYAYRTCKTDHHPAGTCAMGSGANAVVTPDLKLRGLLGIRVVDASVMPFVPSSNTNAPTIMIAEKASDMILGKAPLPAAIL